MITVYHNKNFLDIRYYSSENPAELIDPTKLTRVATVATDDLEEAYGLTQNFTSSWINNKGVKSYGTGEKRSTSVGDVLWHEGKAYLVAFVGFVKVDLQLQTPF